MRWKSAGLKEENGIILRGITIEVDPFNEKEDVCNELEDWRFTTRVDRDPEVIENSTLYLPEDDVAAAARDVMNLTNTLRLVVRSALRVRLPAE